MLPTRIEFSLPNRLQHTGGAPDGSVVLMLFANLELMRLTQVQRPLPVPALSRFV